VKRFWIEPVALGELEDAAAWYESQRPGLGDEFIATVPVAAVTGGLVRREFVHRFPPRATP
jgi:hypothetical protein